MLGAWLLAGPAPAQEGQRIGFEVTVSHVSPEPGSIDPRAKDLHERLSKEIRYESLKVLEKRKLNLGLDEIGTVKLPNGGMVRLRPLDVGSAGVLVAVDVEGSVKTDLRLPNRKMVVIGGQPYQDGRLVITLEPRY